MKSIIKVFSPVFKLLVIALSLGYLVYMLYNQKESVHVLASSVGVFSNFALLGALMVFMLLNWILEAVKWKISIQNFQIISLFHSLKSVWVGVSMGVFTPNRMGELFGRAVLLHKEVRLKSIGSAALCSVAQLSNTLFWGLIGLFYFDSVLFSKLMLLSRSYSKLTILFLVFFVFLLLFVIKKKSKVISRSINHLKFFSLRQVASVFLLSMVRYSIFLIQFNICFSITGLPSFSWNMIWAVAVIYLLTTAIPTSSLGELGVRGSVAVFVLHSLPLFTASTIAATFLLWLVNLFLPAVIGNFILWGKR